MNSLAERYRTKSKEISAVADTLFEADDFDQSPRKQTMAVIGKVNANTYLLMADLVDYIDSQQYGGVKDERRQQVISQYRRVNLAAAKGLASGDWTEFDKLLAGNGEGGD